MPEQCEEVVQLAAQGRAALPGSEQGARTRLLVDDHHARCQQREAGCQQARDHPGARHGGGYWFSFFYDPSLTLSAPRYLEQWQRSWAAGCCR